MILDTLSNAGKYHCVHPSFAKAFEYIKSQDLQSIAPGNYEIDGDSLKAVVFNKPGKSVEESISKFECHNQHIDIQVCISGLEQIGWKPRESCTRQKGAYNPEKDVLYYDDTPEMYFQMRDHQFVIFFPEDVHAPMIGEGDINKLVVKVKI
jgi:biofilm protein TabA